MSSRQWIVWLLKWPKFIFSGIRVECCIMRPLIMLSRTLKCYILLNCRNAWFSICYHITVTAATRGNYYNDDSRYRTWNIILDHLRYIIAFLIFWTRTHRTVIIYVTVFLARSDEYNPRYDCHGFGVQSLARTCSLPFYYYFKLLSTVHVIINDQHATRLSIINRQLDVVGERLKSSH